MAQGLMTSSSKYSGMKTTNKPFKVSSPSGDATFKKSVRRSTGNLAAQFSTTSLANGGGMTTKSSSDLERIETEYIKNLQQQVYFLELEANYLRDEARKATELQPQMKAEAQQMVTRLAEFQSDIERLQIELKRKSAELDGATNEKERMLGKLKAAEDSHQREKRLLHDEIVQLKKEKDLLDRSLVNKDAEIIDIHKQLEACNSAIRTDENKIRLLETQLTQKSDQLQLLQRTLDDKRAELLRAEAKLRETEEKYYSSAATINDKVKDDLREEIRLLKQKLKETELTAGQDRYLRSKLNDDNTHLVKENSYLSEQVLEMQKQLERERSARETTDSRRSQSFTELVTLKDQENQLRAELDQTKEQLKSEQQKVRHYVEQLSHLEQSSTGHQLSLTTARSRIAELTSMHQSAETEITRMRRDNDLVSDRISELQKQIAERDSVIDELESRVRQLEPLEELHSTIHSQKWEEFSRLANSMKTLARRTQGSPQTSGSNRSAAATRTTTT